MIKSFLLTIALIIVICAAMALLLLAAPWSFAALVFGLMWAIVHEELTDHQVNL